MSNKVIEADANKAIVDEFLNAFSTGDVPRIAAHLHDAAHWWVSGTVLDVRGESYDSCARLNEHRSPSPAGGRGDYSRRELR